MLTLWIIICYNHHYHYHINLIIIIMDFPCLQVRWHADHHWQLALPLRTVVGYVNGGRTWVWPLYPFGATSPCNHGTPWYPWIFTTMESVRKRHGNHTWRRLLRRVHGCTLGESATPGWLVRWLYSIIQPDNGLVAIQPAIWMHLIASCFSPVDSLLFSR